MARGSTNFIPAQADLRDEAGHTLITAYAVKRPGGEWSLLIINKDPSNAHEVKLSFTQNGNDELLHFAGDVKVVTFGAEEYVWHPSGATSHADPAGPARTGILHLNAEQMVALPKASITVLTGELASASK